MQAFDGTYPTASVQLPRDDTLPPGGTALECCCRLVEHLAARSDLEHCLYVCLVYAWMQQFSLQGVGRV